MCNKFLSFRNLYFFVKDLFLYIFLHFLINAELHTFSYVFTFIFLKNCLDIICIFITFKKANIQRNFLKIITTTFAKETKDVFQCIFFIGSQILSRFSDFFSKNTKSRLQKSKVSFLNENYMFKKCRF